MKNKATAEVKAAAARGARAAGRLYEALDTSSAQQIAAAHHERADRLEREAAALRIKG